MKEIRMCVLGPGKIFHRVMADADRFENCRFTAAASANAERAEAARKEFGLEDAFVGYEAMAASDKVDLVYVATPHNFHADQAILCMEHKKHVIVEKPITLNRKEFSRLIECAKKNNVFLMEAMWTWLMPAIREVYRKAQAGEFGSLLHMTAAFSNRCGVDPSSRLYSMKLAGGSLMDVGPYVVAIAQYFAGGPALETQTFCRKAFTGVDTEMSINAVYACGATAQLCCGLDVTMPSALHLYYSDAHVYVPEFWHAESYTVYRGGKAETFTLPREHEGHHYEFNHAAECINNGLLESPVITHEQSMNVIGTMEDIRVRHGIIYPEEL